MIYKRNDDGSEDKTTIISYGGGRRENVIIPDGVINIGHRSFYDAKLSSVKISNSVANIESIAFEKNYLTTITIPSSVMKIGTGAFRDNKLTNVKIIGKGNLSEFTTYGTNIWGWDENYSDSNIEWNRSN